MNVRCASSKVIVPVYRKAAIHAFRAVARAIEGEKITAQDKTNLCILYAALADALWPKVGK